MNRRQLLKSLGLLGLNAGLASNTSAFASELVKHSKTNGSLSPEQAFSSSFLSIPESYGPTRVKFDRPLPSELRGTLFRNGPARMHRGDTRYRHWFDGDGMVHSFNLRGAELVHQAKMVQTTKLIEEELAGRFLRDGFGTHLNDALPVLKPDDLNVANISVLPLGDELLALWEAGSAWRLDSKTLDTLGRKVFSPETDGVSFSAHPRMDPDGHLWNFGYLSGAGKLVIYDMSANGELNRTQVIDATHTNMVHDFAVTERFLVFVLMPITFEGKNDVSFADMLGWDEDGSVEILLIDKATLNVQHRFELPPFFAFHFGNAWEDGKQLRIEVATSEPWKEFNSSVKQAVAGKLPTQAQIESRDLAQAQEIVLDLDTKTARSESLPFLRAEFPSFDPRFAGYRTQSLTMLTRSRELPDAVFGFNQISRFDRRQDSVAEWAYGNNFIAEEHVFVPQSNAKEGTGWLVGTAFDWVNSKTTLSVFNAESIHDGPISVCTLPYHLPLGFHGKFVNAA